MKKQRILLVDDSSNSTSLFRKVLERTGRFIVKEENAGGEALDTARRFHPDLIFLERHVGGVDGREMAARLKSDAELNSVPVAFIAGLNEEDQVADDEYGFQTLAKPVWPGDLIDFATDLVEGRRPRQKVARCW